MMGSWWFLWMVFMFMFLLTPLGYGWGYRGWGPPYPRYMQRRRGPQAAAGDGPGTPHHLSWGWRGDFVWMIVFVGSVWAVTALSFPLWRR